MKKIITLILVLSICITSIIPVSATSESFGVFTQTEFNEISRIIYDSYNFNVFNLSNYSLTDLRLASPINSYTYINNNLVATTNQYIPVYYNNSICGVVISFVSDDNETNYTYNESYSSELNSFINENNSLAIIGVEDGLLAISEDDYTVLSGTVTNDEITALVQNTNNYNYSEVEQYSDHELNMVMSMRSSNTVLKVFKYKQEDVNDCWITSVRSIGNYKKPYLNYGQEYLVDYAIDLFGDDPDYNGYGNILQTRTLLNSAYSMSSVAHSGSISMTSLVNNIDNYNPVLAGCKSSTGTYGHMVVFNGYSSSSQYFAFVYMDPDDGAYHTVNTTSKVHIVVDNVTYNCVAYITL